MELKRKLGDRYDGYRVKKVEPFFLVVPYIMKTRVDSQVYFSEKVDITELEKFVRDHASSDIPGLKTYHVVIAALVRLISQRPYLNRFIAGSKIYARKHISISMALKRSMSDNSETTTIKPMFEPDEVLQDIVKKFNEAVEANKTTVQENSTDFVAKVIGNMPGIIVKLVVGFLMNLDKVGWMPKVINRVSPFHTSMFLTNLGSIGINSIYHHIYEFGTTSIFVAIGKKYTERVIDDNGNIIKKRYMDMKVVADERICDGYYYAYSMRMLAKILKNPEILLNTPESVIIDDGIIMKGRVKKKEKANEEQEMVPAGIEA